MTRDESIRYLLQDGNLSVPCSRYGRDTLDCAPVSYRFAFIVAKETGTDVDTDQLDHAMSLVVNDHDDVQSIIREYGRYDYGHRTGDYSRYGRTS